MSDTAPTPASREHTQRRWYASAAIVALNTLLLFVALNLALAAAYWVRGRSHGPLAGVRADSARLSRVYPGWTMSDLAQLLQETDRPLDFEPYTVFRETPRNGRFVNIDTAGFRRTSNQGAWPPDSNKTNIFVFGGSTSLGYAVADGETQSSRLQEKLNGLPCAPDVRVYNFGRAYYYSAQERILFERLLTQGRVPAIAVFVDGLNDSWIPPGGVATVMRGMRRLFDAAQDPTINADLVAIAWSKLPVFRFARGLLRRIAKPAAPPAGDYMASYPPAVAIRRWRANKEFIQAAAQHAGVATLFVWQPVPWYEYDTRANVYYDPRIAEQFSPTVYPAMAAEHRAGRLADVLWLADMQKDRTDPLYVDDIHYSAAFLSQIADSIAAELAARKLVCGRR